LALLLVFVNCFWSRGLVVKVTLVQLPLVPYESMVAAERASVQNCSRHQ